MPNPRCDGVLEPALDEDRLRTDSLAASVVVLLVLTVVQRLVGFLRGVLFCRWLDAEQLGQWDMAFSFLMLAAPLAVLGLPGSLGRYVEHYRRQGRLKSFLFRTSLGTLLLAALAVVTAFWSRRWLAGVVFGSGHHAELVVLLAPCLGVVILYNFLTSLFTALRQVKVASVMQFAGGLLFAVLGISLLLAWNRQCASVLIAFSGACLLASVGSLLWMRRIWRIMPAESAGMPSPSVWTRLVPFAFWLWMTNAFSNLFAITDRLMIVHYSGLPSDGAMTMVGQYHTARIFPLLFVSVAELLAAVITPHLSSDWEAGKRQLVSSRLALFLKTFGIGLVATSILVLVVAPVLFDYVWQARYGQGLAVLPLALVCSIWTGVAFVSNNYLWCAEKSRLVTATLLAGLLLNAGLNLLLLPPLGLLGAVLATTIARLGSLCLVWWFARRLGMRIDRGLLVLMALPVFLCFGPWIALAVLLAVLVGIIPGVRFFNREERQAIWEMIGQGRLRLRHVLVRRKVAMDH